MRIWNGWFTFRMQMVLHPVLIGERILWHLNEGNIGNRPRVFYAENCTCSGALRTHKAGRFQKYFLNIVRCCCSENFYGCANLDPLFSTVHGRYFVNAKLCVLWPLSYPLFFPLALSQNLHWNSIFVAS